MNGVGSLFFRGIQFFGEALDTLLENVFVIGAIHSTIVFYLGHDLGQCFQRFVSNVLLKCISILLTILLLLDEYFKHSWIAGHRLQRQVSPFKAELCEFKSNLTGRAVT